METSVEDVVVDGDDEVLEVALGGACHVVGEAVAVHRQRGAAELVGEVALGVEVDEQYPQSHSGQVFDV